MSPHTPPHHTTQQQLPRPVLGCIGGSGKGPGCVCSPTLHPFPAPLWQPEEPRDIPHPPTHPTSVMAGAGQGLQVGFGSVIKSGAVGADPLSREPAVPETHCLWPREKQTRFIDKSMDFITRAEVGGDLRHC